MPKKIKRNIFICIIVVLLALAAIALMNFYPLLNMKPVETGSLGGTEIISVKNNINDMFFIKTNSGYIVIDAGTDKEAIEKTLDELSISPSDVRHLLLTHSDYDHVGSLVLFTNAQLYMGEDELQMVNETTKRNKLGYNSLPDGIDINNAELLADGQELFLDGQSVKCIKSPGHTPGSMSYLVDGKYLFTGDAIRIKDNSLLIHPFTMDEQEAQKSIEKLKKAKEGSSLLLTAHYGYYDSEGLK